jgi:hypothetical protein
MLGRMSDPTGSHLTEAAGEPIPMVETIDEPVGAEGAEQ